MIIRGAPFLEFNSRDTDLYWMREHRHDMTPHDQPTQLQPAFQPEYRAYSSGDSNGVAPRTVALITVMSLLLGAAGGAGAGAFVVHNTTSTRVSTAAPKPVSALQSEQLSFSNASRLAENVVLSVGPAVVSIRNDQQPQQDFFGNTSQAVSAGSGVVIDGHGYILTNYHVISDAQDLNVTFANATTARAVIVGSDPSSDIAVIKVNVQVPAVAQFGDSSQVKAGETVIAIGNALGNLQNTVTEGIISGLNRTLPNGNDATGQEMLQSLIQTDAAINHGNSGGPLVDLDGHVIGINTAVVRTSSSSSTNLLGSADQAEGLGFAIPSNTARAVADRLIFHTPTPSLGIRYEPVSSQMASSYRMPSGAAVRSVIAHSAAAQAGLKAQDIITAVDGQKIDDTHDLKVVVETHRVGDHVKLTFYRGGQYHIITVALGTAAN